MKKYTIKNSGKLNLTIAVYEKEESTGLAFVMHGLSGHTQEPHIITARKVLEDIGFTVVVFDTTHSFGESEGDYQNATLTQYYTDLEDVISWSQSQDWYQEPFTLTGHSLGGYSTTLYAQNNPSKVKLLIPLAPVVSGQSTIDGAQKHHPAKLQEWNDTGWRIEQSGCRPELVKKLNWTQYKADIIKHDLNPRAQNLIMPQLWIAAENDKICPPGLISELAEKTPGETTVKVIPNAPHTWRSPEALRKQREFMKEWINKKIN